MALHFIRQLTLCVVRFVGLLKHDVKADAEHYKCENLSSTTSNAVRQIKKARSPMTKLHAPFSASFCRRRRLSITYTCERVQIIPRQRTFGGEEFGDESPPIDV